MLEHDQHEEKPFCLFSFFVMAKIHNQQTSILGILGKQTGSQNVASGSTDSA